MIEELYAAEKLALTGRILRSKTHTEVPVLVAHDVLDRWRPDAEPTANIDAMACRLRRRRRSIRRAIGHLVEGGFFHVVEESSEGVVLRPNFASVKDDAARKRERFGEPQATWCSAFAEAAHVAH